MNVSFSCVALYVHGYIQINKIHTFIPIMLYTYTRDIYNILAYISVYIYMIDSQVIYKYDRKYVYLPVQEPRTYSCFFRTIQYVQYMSYSFPEFQYVICIEHVYISRFYDVICREHVYIYRFQDVICIETVYIYRFQDVMCIEHV